jgi:hypothetical protein
VSEYLKVAASVRPNPVERELHINSVGGGLHHETVFMNPEKDGQPHQYAVSLPFREASAIICTTDEKTKKQSLFLYVDLYRNWPQLDAEGDEIRQCLEGGHAAYCDAMDTPEYFELKKKILTHTKIIDVPKSKVDEAVRATPMHTRVKSPIHQPVFPPKHEQAGEPDESKSPQFILKYWDMEVTAEKKAFAKDLVINNGRQKVITKTYDFREKIDKNMLVTTEEGLQEFMYYKGSAEEGKDRFRLDIQATIPGVTYFFPKEKKADMQIKASDLAVMKKTIEAGNFGMTVDDVEALKMQYLTYVQTAPKRAAPDDLESGRPEKKQKADSAQETEGSEEESD